MVEIIKNMLICGVPASCLAYVSFRAIWDTRRPHWTSKLRQKKSTERHWTELLKEASKKSKRPKQKPIRKKR